MRILPFVPAAVTNKLRLNAVLPVPTELKKVANKLALVTLFALFIYIRTVRSFPFNTVVEICVNTSIKSFACNVFAGIAALNTAVFVVVFTRLEPDIFLPKISVVATPKSVRTSAGVLGVTVLSALTRKYVMALGFGSVIRLLPTVVDPDRLPVIGELTIKEEKAAALPDVMTFFQLGIIRCFLR